MNSSNLSYRIFPLGDAAFTIELGDVIDENVSRKVLALFHLLSADPFTGMIEAVPAYTSVTVYYDIFQISKTLPPDKTVYEFVGEKLNQRLQGSLSIENTTSRTVSIPVCYEKEFAPDTAQLAKEKKLSVQEVMDIHLAKPYRVYMLGFLPGFAYMGEVDERISMNRKSQPEQVAAGSIGIAGRQTGIYPLASPGGWHIIGRTPLRLFDAMKEEPTLLKAGDIVQFVSISKNEFENY